MSRRGVLVLIAMVASAAIVALIYGHFLQTPMYVLEAGPIRLERSGEGRLVSGTFTVRGINRADLKGPSPSRELVGAGWSTQQAGACLIADPSDLGVDDIPCASESECDTALSSLGRGWKGYCDASNNKCWARPGPGTFKHVASEPFCNRSPDHDPVRKWPEGTHQANRRLLDPRLIPGWDPGEVVNWRVYACMTTDEAGQKCVMGEPLPVRAGG